MKSPFWKGFTEGFIIALPPAFLLIAYAGVSSWVVFLAITYVMLLSSEFTRRFK